MSSDIALEPRVRLWLEVREPLECQLRPLGQIAIDALSPVRGERILDVGCGIGTTPAELARRVGTGGEVVAIDTLVSALRLQNEQTHATNVRFVHGDAAHQPFLPRSFDAVYSRFGVMFFADAVQAFRNLRSALCQGGRIAFICWRGVEENELDALPLTAARPHIPHYLVDAVENAPFLSFSRSGAIDHVLTKAGFADIRIVPHDTEVGSGNLAAMVDVCSRVGALGSILRDHPEYRAQAVSSLEQALAARDGPDGPMLRTATWVVTARNPQ